MSDTRTFRLEEKTYKIEIEGPDETVLAEREIPESELEEFRKESIQFLRNTERISFGELTGEIVGVEVVYPDGEKRVSIPLRVPRESLSGSELAIDVGDIDFPCPEDVERHKDLLEECL